MFKDVLEMVVDGTEGGIAALLMGYDGIPVEQYIRNDEAIDVRDDRHGVQRDPEGDPQGRRDARRRKRP